jgi:CRP-like cAMP-binding protein
MIKIMSETTAALFQGGRQVDLDRGDVLFRTGDAVLSMFFVTTGRVDLIRHGPDGQRMILHRGRPGEVMAEASAYSDRYHCDAVAVSEAGLTAIPVDEFQGMLASDPDLARVWAAGLARALQRARTSAEIRTLRTVSARLDAWLEGGRALPDRGQWQDLAEEIGVSREALYRELAKRR